MSHTSSSFTIKKSNKIYALFPHPIVFSLRRVFGHTGFNEVFLFDFL